MKLLVLLALLAFEPVWSTNNEDRTITQVVKVLQGMLAKSQKEGDEERVIYAKFKCYCDTSEAEKKESIKQLTKQIEVLKSRIAELQALTGELSSECADLKARMAENEQVRKEATAIRGKESAAFKEEEEDLTQAISQMSEAIDVLAEVGGDQTMSTGADHKQFMAAKEEKAGLLSLQSKVQAALKAASALMTSKQRAATMAFVQAPFTGTYTSQSGEVVGILKDMRDTFKTNLATATENEKKAQEAFDKFMKIKTEEHDRMSKSYDEKQGQLGDNDEMLASKKQALSAAQAELASDEEFLEKLLTLCSDKAKSYEERKVLRANEEAAIAEAISILNSDAAFATFGKTDATSTGGTGGDLTFIQMRSVRRHETADARVRRMAKRVLEAAAKKVSSKKMGKVAALLEAGNPFTTVLEEIQKMLNLIGEEAKQDKENLDWCNSERTENHDNLAAKEDEIVQLQSSIQDFTDEIENPETGLKALIQETEESLVQNTESQKTQTKERTEANVAYQADVKNSVDAQAILQKGIKVLKAYYDKLAKDMAEKALVQEDPDAPETWEGYEGQSEKGGDVINMLEYILSEAKKEETEAHSDEEKAQAEYEDSMASLKEKEATAEKDLARLQDTLAETEKELLETKDDLKKTVKDKEAIEAYLAKIKPGCDFITSNFDTREANRKTETAALNKATDLIKETPAYKAAVAEAHVESFGKCKELCVPEMPGSSAGEDTAKCKACMADVTVPAYCAGHPETVGC